MANQARIKMYTKNILFYFFDYSEQRSNVESNGFLERVSFCRNGPLNRLLFKHEKLLLIISICGKILKLI